MRFLFGLKVELNEPELIVGRFGEDAQFFRGSRGGSGFRTLAGNVPTPGLSTTVLGWVRALVLVLVRVSFQS